MIMELAERVGALRNLECQQALEVGIGVDRGCVFLTLTDDQYAKLKTKGLQRSLGRRAEMQRLLFRIACSSCSGVRSSACGIGRSVPRCSELRALRLVDGHSVGQGDFVRHTPNVRALRSGTGRTQRRHRPSIPPHTQPAMRRERHY